jgi:LPXTG-motif cell wall-anchored protein
MRQALQRFTLAFGIGAIGLTGTAFAQQTTTSTEVKTFDVIAVDGNKLILKDAAGASKEYTVPPGFMFTIGGKQVPVSDVKPGMSGTATITTTTTVTPVRVTEVKNGEVVQATGNSLLIKGPEGFKMFTPGDVQKRNVTIMKDGKPVDFASLHAGDRLSAVIITEGPPTVMTDRQVQAALTAAPGAAPGSAATGATAKPAPGASTGSSTAKPAPAMAEGNAGAGSTAKKLPKTASQAPVVLLAGLLLLAAGATMTMRRQLVAR